MLLEPLEFNIVEQHGTVEEKQCSILRMDRQATSIINDSLHNTGLLQWKMTGSNRSFAQRSHLFLTVILQIFPITSKIVSTGPDLV